MKKRRQKGNAKAFHRAMEPVTTTAQD